MAISRAPTVPSLFAAPGEVYYWHRSVAVMITPNHRLRNAAIAALAAALPVAFLAPAGASATAPGTALQAAAATPDPSPELDLGAPGLPESRTVTTLAPRPDPDIHHPGNPQPGLLLDR